MMTYRFKKYNLIFRFDAGTSRGVLRSKTSWFIQLEMDGRVGVGECGILNGLSIEDYDNYEENLNSVLNSYCKNPVSFDWSSLDSFPSIRFGLEMAEFDLRNEGNGILYSNKFTSGKKSISINGLVWMGEYSFMYDQIKKKIDDGFGCIKIKIGAIEFEKEISLLKYIRSDFDHKDIEIRVDANGAFAMGEALEKLKRLADYNLHSIEQPIKPCQWEEMSELCDKSPLPIALDEELIGIYGRQSKKNLVQSLRPQYIILKPSLIGGYASSNEWIEVAEEANVGYWVTSALESNIGLNAIAQWTHELAIDMPQGLGTGQLYDNNFEGPLFIKKGELHFNPELRVYQNFNLFG